MAKSQKHVDQRILKQHIQIRLAKTIWVLDRVPLISCLTTNQWSSLMSITFAVITPRWSLKLLVQARFKADLYLYFAHFFSGLVEVIKVGAHPIAQDPLLYFNSNNVILIPTYSLRSNTQNTYQIISHQNSDVTIYYY